MLFGDTKRLYDTLEYVKSKTKSKQHRHNPFSLRSPTSKSDTRGLVNERGMEKERDRLGGLEFRRGDNVDRYNQYPGERLSQRGDRSPAMFNQENNVDLSILHLSPTSSLRYSYDSKGLDIDTDLIGLIPNPHGKDSEDSEDVESDDMEDDSETEEKINIHEGKKGNEEKNLEKISQEIEKEDSEEKKFREKEETVKRNQDKANKENINNKEDAKRTIVGHQTKSKPQSDEVELRIEKICILPRTDSNSYRYEPGGEMNEKVPSSLTKMLNRKNANILSSKYRGTATSQMAMGYQGERERLSTRGGKAHRRNTSTSTVVVIYLPNRKPIELKVSEPCTVMELLLCVLQYLRERKPPQADFSKLQDLTNPDAYELRLHDIGGEPEDFALDKRKDIKDFNEEDQPYEFCLKYNPSKNKGVSSPEIQLETNKVHEQDLTKRRTNFDSQQTVIIPTTNRGYLRKTTTMDGFDNINEFYEDDDDDMDGLEGIGQGIIMKVVFPNNFIECIDVTLTTTINEILQMILLRHQRFRFESWCLYLSDQSDKEKLGFTEYLLSGDLQVKDLRSVRELIFDRQHFDDEPQRTGANQSNSNLGRKTELGRTSRRTLANPGRNQRGANPNAETTTVQGRHGKKVDIRPDADTFVFTDVLAFVYKEWNVIKTNYLGKRQNRILGIDEHKLYNYKKNKLGNKQADAVQRPYRLIKNITTVEFLASENQFKIDLDEDGKLRTLEYETKTAYECAEIVYKLRYIMKGKR